MKILTNKRIKSLTTMIRGSSEDREIAISILEGKKKKSKKKGYKITIDKDQAILWYNRNGALEVVLTSRGDFTNENTREEIINRFRDFINNQPAPFKRIELFY